MIHVAVSGGFDPLHIGHVRMIERAKAMFFPCRLTVIVNNDNWLVRKKGFVFMPESERVEIIQALRHVDTVMLTDHGPGCEDMTVCTSLHKLKDLNIFCNGGDRVADNTPEEDYCRAFGVRMEFGVGGEKIQSSSWLTGACCKK
jgi:cytidyltransferase-like protein